MALKKMGFIVRGRGFDPEQHRQVMESPAFTLMIAGIGDLSQAPAAAQRLVAEGAEMLELCGAFGPRATAEVIAAIQDAVPVGVVAYDNDALDRLVALFG